MHDTSRMATSVMAVHACWMLSLSLAGMRNNASVRRQVCFVFVHVSFSDVCCMLAGHDCIGSSARLVAG
jgi:hypothetical protein